MKARVAVLVVSALLCSWPAIAADDFAWPGRGWKAEELVRQCKAVENVDLEALKVPTQDALKVGLCVGFIVGILDGDALTVMVDKAAAKEGRIRRARLPITCVPSAVSNAQLAKVIVKYGDNHPEEIHLPSALFVVNAVSGAFPCEIPAK